MNLKQISIYPFEKEDQADVKALILVGLEEHWGQQMVLFWWRGMKKKLSAQVL